MRLMALNNTPGALLPEKSAFTAVIIGLIKPLNIIARHIVDKESVQAFSAPKENGNDFSLDLRARSVSHATDNIVFISDCTALSQGPHPDNKVVIRCRRFQPKVFFFQHILFDV